MSSAESFPPDLRSELRKQFQVLISLGPMVPPSMVTPIFSCTVDRLLESFQEQVVLLRQIKSSSAMSLDLTGISSSTQANQRRCFEVVVREQVVSVLDEQCRRLGLPLLWGMPLEVRALPATWRPLLDYVLPALLQVWDSKGVPLEVVVQVFLSECDVFLWEGRSLPVEQIPTTVQQFSNAPDYFQIRWSGQVWDLNRKQAAMVRVLHRAWLSGWPDVADEKLLEVANAPR